jgi:heme exporter protein D
MTPLSLAHLALLAAGSTPDEDQVTPGVIGFFAIFFLAAATILLVLDMVRRVRRTRYRGEVREQLQREQREQADAEADNDTPTP